MTKYEKLLQYILLRQGDANISFIDICHLMTNLGFKEKIKGDHHIFTKKGIEKIINIQPKNNKAKPYQVKQIRNIILHYNIKIGE